MSDTEQAVEATSSTDTQAGTTAQAAPAHPLSTAGTVDLGDGQPDAGEGRAADAAPEAAKTDPESTDDPFKDVPKDLRPHVEKAAKKYEADFKRNYTKKTMDLAAKESQWSTREQQYQSQLQQFKTIAEDVLAHPEKLGAYREVLGLHAAETGAKGIPPEIQTVGDLLDYNKQQMETYKESLKTELRQEAQTTVKQATAVTRWEQALGTKRADKHFTKYEKFIIDIAQTDPEVTQLWNRNNPNEVVVLDAAQSKLRELMREDMDEVREKTLKDQKQKAKITTQVPTKVTQPLPRSAQTREDAIARVREKYGPPSAPADR